MLKQEMEDRHRVLELTQAESGIKVKVRFNYIEAIRQSEAPFANLEYPVDMNMGEAVRKLDGTALIQFSLRVATDPKVVVFAVKGEATVKGPPEIVQRVTIPDKDSPPAIWREIYQEAITTIAFLARFFDIPPPPVVVNM